MNVLVIGRGGREHALAWSLARSSAVSKVFVAPGNPGTAGEAKVENIALGEAQIDELIEFAQRQEVALTVVGPEAPLVAGIRDRFDAVGLPCFGPTAGAAQLEGSKAFAKEFMQRHGIPTAASATFTDLDAAGAYIVARGAPIVVKADGLAAGKGVIVAATVAEALAAVSDMLAGDAFGAAGAKVVIEDCLVGEEASFIVMADGERAIPFATSQDHKRVGDGDQGPNTGGMGAYSPAPVMDAEVHARAMREVIEPTIRGMAADGHPFQGFLYAGLMVMPDKSIKVIEFNCRFGDPEAQPVLARLESDLFAAMRAAVAGRLDQVELRFVAGAALGVVMASEGYPGSYETGHAITGLAEQGPLGDVGSSKVFHAGTRFDEQGRVVTDGGRVVCVVGMGESVADAQRIAYDAVGRVTWEGAFCRRDIGYRAVTREART